MPGGVTFDTGFDTGKVNRAVKHAQFKNLGHAGAVIRKVAAGSIKVGTGPSAKGTPPNTRKKALPKSILYAVEHGRRLVVGPSYKLVRDSGRAHEHGGEFRGDQYDRRPFMAPTLLKVRSQIPRVWRGSVRG